MAQNILDISILSPFQWTKEGYANPLPYNTKYRDDWQYPETIGNWYEKKPYMQPWQKNDILPFQVLSNYAPHQLELYDCEGNQVSGGIFQLTYKASSIEGTGQKAYEAFVALDDFEEGVYQFKIKSGSPVLETYVSNFFSIKELQEDTMLFEVTHDENDYDMVFETGIITRLRVYGEIREFQPGSDRTIFIDQPRNAVQLAGKSFSTEKLIIGDSFGVPDYMIEKINNLFLCSNVLIDGKQWVGNEGARFEAKREELYPMSGWAFEIRPAKASTKKRFIADGNQGSPTTVTYNIEQKGYGPSSSPASSNIIQIEELQ
jgi:hypothetical protein